MTKTVFSVEDPDGTELPLTKEDNAQRAFDALMVPPTAEDVRREARRRIVAQYPEWKQLNMTMRGVELQDIWRRLGRWSASEQAEAAELQAAADWIKNVRAASNVMEPNAPANYRDDTNWPTRKLSRRSSRRSSR